MKGGGEGTLTDTGGEPGVMVNDMADTSAAVGSVCEGDEHMDLKQGKCDIFVIFEVNTHT